MWPSLGFRERPDDSVVWLLTSLRPVFAASDWMSTNVGFPRILIMTYKYEWNISTILEIKCYFNISLKELQQE